MKTLKPKSCHAGRRWKMVCLGVLAVFFVWACLPARPFRPIEPIPGGIVDMHCHIAGIGAGESGCWVSPRMLNNWRFNIYLHSFGVSKKELLEKGDGLVGDRISESLAQSQYVSKAVLLALDGVVDAQGNLDTRRILKVPGCVLKGPGCIPQSPGSLRRSAFGIFSRGGDNRQAGADRLRPAVDMTASDCAKPKMPGAKRVAGGRLPESAAKSRRVGGTCQGAKNRRQNCRGRLTRASVPIRDHADLILPGAGGRWRASRRGTTRLKSQTRRSSTIFDN